MSTSHETSPSESSSNGNSGNTEIPKPNPALDRGTTKSDPRPIETRIIVPNTSDKKK